MSFFGFQLEKKVFFCVVCRCCLTLALFWSVRLTLCHRSHSQSEALIPIQMQIRAKIRAIFYRAFHSGIKYPSKISGATWIASIFIAYAATATWLDHILLFIRLSVIWVRNKRKKTTINENTYRAMVAFGIRVGVEPTLFCQFIQFDCVVAAFFFWWNQRHTKQNITLFSHLISITYCVCTFSPPTHDAAVAATFSVNIPFK